MAGSKNPIPYEIKFENSLLDNVHGLIGLTAVENAIEKLPIFKRLHGISQLGLTNRIFPCALHNRYTHSLGVVHIVDQMAVSLNFDSDERQIIRLAAMLHDIGHYPFSHDVESVYKEMAPEAKKVASDGKATKSELHRYAQNAHKKIEELDSNKKLNSFFRKGTLPARHHELIGTIVIKHSNKIKNAINDLYIKNSKKYQKTDNAHTLDSIIADICAIITGNTQHDSEYFSDKFCAMVQLLHSELDADKIDYLLRDATFSGASYGNFDAGMLIKFLKMKRDKDGKHYIVGVEPKGICCAEQFLLNRYFAYNQIIFHKYSSMLGCALQSVVRWMLQDTASQFTYVDIESMAERHEIEDRYINYTDATLISCINAVDTRATGCPKIICELITCLKNYQSPNMSEEYICSGTKPSELKKQIIAHPLYSKLNSAVRNESTVCDIYQYREVLLTQHVLQAEFDKLPRTHNTKDKPKEEGEDLKESMRLDRLLDGIAVIEEGKAPCLLIDHDRSMLHDIGKLRYCILRTYTLSENAQTDKQKSLRISPRA